MAFMEKLSPWIWGLPPSSHGSTSILPMTAVASASTICIPIPFLFTINLIKNTILRRYTVKNYFAAFMCFFSIFILVIAIFLSTCFVLMITNKTDAKEAPGRACKEYKSTDGYSSSFKPYGSSSTALGIKC
ncbi:hypothetical protein SLA2020_225070 [Shorea laevis]